MKYFYIAIIGCSLHTISYGTDTPPSTRVTPGQAQYVIDQISKTIVDDIEPILSTISVVESKIDDLNVVVQESAQSIITAIGTAIEDCCSTTMILEESIIEALEPIFSKVCIVDSKVDLLGASIIDHNQELITAVEHTIADASSTVIQELGITLQDQSNSIIEQITITICDKVESIIDDFAHTIVDHNSSLIDTLGVTIVDQSSSVIDQLGTTIIDQTNIVESKLDGVDAGINSGPSCAPISLSSADIVSGAITITASGNYCLTEDVTADIIVTASNVCLTLGCHRVTGSLNMNGNSISIFNGAIIGQPNIPSVVTIAPTSILNKLSNCIIIGNTIGVGGAAQTGIISNGINTTIHKCFIQTSNGTNGATGGIVFGSGTNPSVGNSGAPGGNGGIGIQNTGSGLHLIESTITTGAGGSGGDGGQNIAESCNQFITGGNGASGGNGGAALINSGSLATITNCSLYTGAGGNGGSGGLITYTNANCEPIIITPPIVQCDCFFACPAPQSLTLASGGNGGNAGNAIECQGNGALIVKCIITTGNGGTGGAAGTSSIDVSVACCPANRPNVINAGSGGNGGTGGTGVTIAPAVARTVIRTCIIDQLGAGGPAGSGTICNQDCSVFPCVVSCSTLQQFVCSPGPDGSSGTGGSGINVNSTAQFTEISSNSFGNIFGGGLAIQDTSSSSTIFANSSHNSGNNPYFIFGAVDSIVGTIIPFDTPDRLANIYTI